MTPNALIDLAAETLVPTTPLPILRNWLGDHGAATEALENHVLTRWWEAATSYDDSRLRRELVEIVEEVRTGPRRRLAYPDRGDQSGELVLDHDTSPEVETLRDVLAEYTGEWLPTHLSGCGREWLTYWSRWHRATEDVAAAVARHVEEVLGIDGDDYEPHWSEWKFEWLTSLSDAINPDARIDERDRWLR